MQRWQTFQEKTNSIGSIGNMWTIMLVYDSDSNKDSTNNDTASFHHQYDTHSHTKPRGQKQSKQMITHHHHHHRLHQARLPKHKSKKEKKLFTCLCTIVQCWQISFLQGIQLNTSQSIPDWVGFGKCVCCCLEPWLCASHQQLHSLSTKTSSSAQFLGINVSKSPSKKPKVQATPKTSSNARIFFFHWGPPQIPLQFPLPK